MLVFLQKRILPSAWGTVMASLRTEFTQKTVPVSAFSGLPPSAGGLKRGSRQVPVQVGGSCGSRTRLSSVSLYVTSVRLAVCDESSEGSQRVFQKSSLPVKLAMLTPASRAFWIAVRI